MRITSNFLRLVLLVSAVLLMIIVIVHPGSESVQDAITHTFAISAGVILHQVVGGTNGDTKRD